MKCGSVSTTLCRAAKALRRQTSLWTGSLVLFTAASSDGIRLKGKHKHVRGTTSRNILKSGAGDSRTSTPTIPVPTLHISVYRTSMPTCHNAARLSIQNVCKFYTCKLKRSPVTTVLMPTVTVKITSFND
jgi:hypothetical protein